MGLHNPIRRAKDIVIETCGNPTYKSVQDWFDTTQSSGKISGGEFTANHDGTLSVGAGTGIIRESATTATEPACFFNWAADAALVLVDESTNYIYVDWNSGSPIVGATVTKSVGNNRDVILLGKVYREGELLHMVEAGMYIAELGKNVLGYLTQLHGEVTRTSGYVIGEVSERYLSSTAGVLWAGFTRITTDAHSTKDSHIITGAGTGGTVSANNTIVFDSTNGDITGDLMDHEKIMIADSSNGNDGTYTIHISSWDGTNTTVEIDETTLTTGADTGSVYDSPFEVYYYDGDLPTPAWVEEHALQIDNLNYNDVATGLSALTPNRYGVHWVYGDADGHLMVVYGQGDYTASQANSANPPSSLPNHVAEFGFIAAKVIIQKSAVAFSQLLSAYETSFTPSGAAVHSELSNLLWSTAGHTIDTNVNMEGNSLIGSSAANGDLTLESTISATKGSLFLKEFGEVRLTSTAPRLSFYDSDAAADTKWWDMYFSSTSMKFRVINDAGSDASTVFDISRTGFATNSITFNPDGADQDFIVEGDADPNLFYVDAGNDKIGMGTATPDYHLHSYKLNGIAGLFEKGSTGTDRLTGACMFKHTTDQDMIDEFGAGISFAIQDSADVENIIGRIGFERSGADDAGDFVVETIPTGGSLTEYFRVTDLGLAGIRTATPVSPLEIEDGGTTAASVVKITQDDANVKGLIIGNDTASTTDTDGLVLNVSDAGTGVINGVAGDVSIAKDGVNKFLINAGGIRFVEGSVTIASGAITISRGYHRVITQGGASTDNLDTITNAVEGNIVILEAEDGGNTVVVRDYSVSGGNIALAGSAQFGMSTKRDKIMLIYSAGTSKWNEVSRSKN